MVILSHVFIALIAALHLGFLALEMFLWTSPTGQKIFGTTEEFALASAALAANQGLYNGFLTAGLLWSYFPADPAHAFSIRMFFLSCVIVAGIFGALTVSPRILWIQAIPAIIALVIEIAAYSFSVPVKA